MSAVLKFLLREHLRAVIETAAEKKSLVLYLSYHEIDEVPDDIAACRTLEHLYLHNNRLTQFPAKVLKLSHLMTLTLDFNRLTSLPPEIACLKQLTNLNISHNPLGQLCPEVCALESLEGLWCNNTGIEELPPEIGNLSQLDVLGARGNKLRTIPDEICKLTKLRWLTLENNEIESLPKDMGALESLIHLNLRRNRLNDFPVSISRCKHLAYFRLADNLLKILPEEFLKAMHTMPRLRVVDIHDDLTNNLSNDAENSQGERVEPASEVETQDILLPDTPSAASVSPEPAAQPPRAWRVPAQQAANDAEPDMEVEESDEDWDNSVASLELDLDYQSDDDLPNRPDVEFPIQPGEEWETSVASLDLNVVHEDIDRLGNVNVQDIGSALPFLSKYTSMAS